MEEALGEAICSTTLCRVVKHGGCVLQTEDAKIWPVLGDRVVWKEGKARSQAEGPAGARAPRCEIQSWVSTASSLVWLEARILGEGKRVLGEEL